MELVELSLESLELKYARLSVRRPAGERRLLGSLGESGQQSPLIVVPAPAAGRFVVIDGHKRVRALKRLKADVAKAAIWRVAEPEALATAHALGSSARRDAFEEGWLVSELHRGFGWPLGAVAERLGRSKSWASKRLALVEELPEWLAEEVSRGRLSAHAAASYLVPLTRVNAEHGRLLAERIRGLGLSNRQIGELYAGYRAANGATRRRIVEDPERFLKTRAAAASEAVVGEGERRCARSLALIGNVSLGLMRSLPEALGGPAAEGSRERLGRAWRACRERFGYLSRVAEELMKEEAGHAGQDDAGSDPVAGGEGGRAAADRAFAGVQPQQRQAGAAGAHA